MRHPLYLCAVKWVICVMHVGQCGFCVTSVDALTHTRAQSTTPQRTNATQLIDRGATNRPDKNRVKQHVQHSVLSEWRHVAPLGERAWCEACSLCADDACGVNLNCSPGGGAIPDVHVCE